MSAPSFRRRLALGTRVLAAELRLSSEGLLEGHVHEGEARRSLAAEAVRAPDGSVLLRVGGEAVRARVVRQGDVTTVVVGGRAYELRDAEQAAPGQAAAEEPFATSPMTGLVAKVSVAPGARVAAGAPLFIVEAMKMEYVVRATREVVVREVRRKAGEKVALGEVVVAFEASAAGRA
ncbi:MAG: biotin/lipoyl-containing protein [Planctomycetia bacterium]